MNQDAGKLHFDKTGTWSLNGEVISIESENKVYELIIMELTDSKLVLKAFEELSETVSGATVTSETEAYYVYQK